MAPRRYWLSLQIGRHQRGALQTIPPPLRDSAFPPLRQETAAGWSGRRGGLKKGGDGGPAEGGVGDQWPQGLRPRWRGGGGVGEVEVSGSLPQRGTQQRLAVPDGEGRAVGRGSGQTRSQTSPRNGSGLLTPQLRYLIPCEPRTGRDRARSTLRWARRVAIMKSGAAGRSAALRTARKLCPRGTPMQGRRQDCRRREHSQGDDSQKRQSRAAAAGRAREQNPSWAREAGAEVSAEPDRSEGGIATRGCSGQDVCLRVSPRRLSERCTLQRMRRVRRPECFAVRNSPHRWVLHSIRVSNCITDGIRYGHVALKLIEIGAFADDRWQAR